MPMNIGRTYLLPAVLTATIALHAALPAPASADDFYKGKTLKMVIRSAAGDGGNDFYGRLLARHMPRFLPGNPGSISVNMPGAAGVVAANYIFSRATRDGAEIAILARAIAVAQRTGHKGVQYDVRKLHALGSAASDVAVIFVTASSPLKTLRDMKRGGPEIKFATTGANGGPYQRGMILRLDGYPVRLITGYGSNGEKVLALMRGEVEMSAGSYDTVIQAVKEEKFRIVGRLGPMPPDLKGDIPDMREVLNEENRVLANMLVAPLDAGRPFYTPPDVPPHRVKMLREAFSKALADRELLAEAEKAGKNVNLTTPEQIETYNQAILSTPDALIERFKQLGAD